MRAFGFAWSRITVSIPAPLPRSPSCSASTLADRFSRRTARSVCVARVALLTASTRRIHAVQDVAETMEILLIACLAAIAIGGPPAVPPAPAQGSGGSPLTLM